VDFHTLIGLTGVAVYVASYAALQLEMLDGNGALYSVMNVAGAAMVLVSLTADFNLASALIQIIWIIIGITGLAIRAYRRRTTATPVAAVAGQLELCAPEDLDPASYADTNRMRVPSASATIRLSPEQLAGITELAS